MKILGYTLAAFSGAIIIIVAVNFGILVLPEKIAPSNAVIELNLRYTDLLTVMFAGATLVLAALAIMVGVVAIFTYQGIKDEAGRTIEKTVAVKSKQLDSQIQRRIQIALEKAGREGALDEALERALVSIGIGGGRLDQEVDQDPEQDTER